MIDYKGYCPNCLKEQNKQPIKPKSKPYANAIRANGNLYQGYRWIILSKKIKERDNYTCAKCHKVFKSKDLVAHHTIEGTLPEDIFYDEDYIITVCFDCHAIIHGRKKANEAIPS